MTEEKKPQQLLAHEAPSTLALDAAALAKHKEQRAALERQKEDAALQQERRMQSAREQAAKAAQPFMRPMRDPYMDSPRDYASRHPHMVTRTEQIYDGTPSHEEIQMMHLMHIHVDEGLEVSLEYNHKTDSIQERVRRRVIWVGPEDYRHPRSRKGQRR